MSQEMKIVILLFSLCNWKVFHSCLRISCLKCRLLLMIQIMFEIIFLNRDVGNMRESWWHAVKAESDWNWQPQPAELPTHKLFFIVKFVLFGRWCTFFPSFFFASSLCIPLLYVQWHVTKCNDCFAAYWTYHFSIPMLHVITSVSTH